MPWGDLGEHRQPSAVEPPFQHLLPALPWLGTWLGTAWEPVRGFYLPTLGICSKEGWQEGWCSTDHRGTRSLSPLAGTGSTGLVTEAMVGAACATTGL